MFIMLLMSCFLFGYDLRIADTLGIWVEGYPDYSSTVTVGPNGEITIPTIGRLYVEGMSIEQAEKLITEKIKQRITMAKVVVGVVNFSPFKVYVLGNVAKQGAVEIRKESVKLSELIAMIGGINDRGKSSTAVIRHKDGKELTVDISKYFGNLLKDDPDVYEGDFVFFPYYYSNSIALLSEFETRLFDYYDGITLKHIVSSMNISMSVIEDDIKILRNSDLLSFSIKDISAGKDLVLEKGDTIIVKKSQNYVYLYYDYSVKTMTFYEGLSIKEMISKQDLSMNTIEDTVQVLRDNKTINVSLKEVMNNKDFLLEKRDTVIIKKARNNIYLFHDSDLKSINYTELLSVRDLVQGLGNQNTLEDEIKVVRNEEIIKLSLKSVVYEKDFDLEKGDTVFITSSKNNVYLFYNSDVKSINYNDKLTLKDIYISLGGSMNNYEDQVRIIRNSKELIFSLKDVIYGSDVKLFKDDKIFVNSSKNNIYLFYNSDVRVMAYNDLLTLKDVYIGLGGSLNNYEDEVIVQRGEETIRVSLKEVVYGKDFNLKKGDYLFITPSKNNIYLFYNSDVRVMAYNDLLTLKDVYMSLGGSLNNYEDEIIVQRGDETLKISLKEVVYGKDFGLKKGDYLFITPSKNNIYLFYNSDVRVMAYNDLLTLKDVYMSLGGSLNNYEDEIIVQRGDETLKISLKEVVYGKDFGLKKGDYLFITPSKNNIYLFYNSDVRVMAYNDLLTLKDVYMSLGGSLNNYEDEIIVQRGDETLKISLKEVVYGKDFGLKKGDYLFITPSKNSVYVYSDFATKVLEYTDMMTLKDIFNSLGVTYEEVDDEISILRGDNLLKFSLSDIIFGLKADGKDFKIEKSDTVFFKRYEKYVFAMINQNVTKVDFKKKDEFTVLMLLSKLAMNPKAVEYIKCEEKELSVSDTLTAKAYIIIEPLKNTVYLNGSFKSTGKISFDFDESLTLARIFSVAGFKEDFSGRLMVINAGGESFEYRIDAKDMSKYLDITVEPQSVLVAFPGERIIYSVGEVADVIAYKDGDTLYDIAMRYKLDESYEIRYSFEATQSTVNAGNADLLKSIELSGKAFMEVTKKVSDYVIVYKDGNSKTFEAKKPVKLIEAFDSMQGFSPSDRGVIKVFTGDTISATYTNYDIINHPLTVVPNGSYVVIQPDVKYSYINVFGSVGFNSIRTDIPISLVEILARSGNNWSNQYEVVIYRPDDTRERIKIQDIDILSRTFVEPGSIVYLPTYDKQIIYMLGQVGAPGVVQYVKGMTLFDALIRAGGVRKDGEPANVFLFKDGPDNPPITLDVSPLFRNSVSLKSSMNPELKPGDIVYVPKSLMTNVVEAMSTVTTFLEFINSTTNSVYNLVNIFVKK
jgi:protein involved in polysaccharide export with SLBB domain